MSARRLTIWQLVLQSQLIHPDWSAMDHLGYLVDDEFRDPCAECHTHPLGVTELIDRWLAENVAAGRAPAPPAAHDPYDRECPCGACSAARARRQPSARRRRAGSY